MYTPHKAKEVLKQLGEQIRLARKRRVWTIAELAKKIGVSAPTVIALEKGKPTVSIGVLVAVLWTLGLESELQSFANPNDVEGIKLMNTRLPKKIRTSKRTLDNDF
ncbi:MAG TPA: helix-turn-helix domain-containing protein [Pseudobdellovibrionaceae bacterium]|nr:helix-turn-helix domain-containing protein [Pseudobdellovibrionaceae bacterium]